MKRLLFLVFFLNLIQTANAFFVIPDSSFSKSDTVYPSFPGGETALFEFLGAHIKYPPECRKAGIEGLVYVKFNVDVHGKVRQVSIATSSGNDLLDKTAMEVIALMPDWNPGTINGNPHSSEYQIPVRFSIESRKFKIETNINPPGEFNYNLLFIISHTQGIRPFGPPDSFPRIDIDTVSLSDSRSFFIVHEFENIKLKRHKLKTLIADSTGRVFLKTRYRFKPEDYNEEISMRNFFKPNFPTGTWTLRFYLNDSLLRERNLFVLPANKEVEIKFWGISAGFQINRFKVLELNYIVGRIDKKDPPFGNALIFGTEHNIDARMNAFKMGFVGSNKFSLGLHIKQFTDFGLNHSFGIQPEAGIGYRLFNFSYGYNLQFKKDFPNINRHFIVARMGVRLKKVSSL